MTRADRRRPAATPTVVFDFGGVLSVGHDPVPDLHEVLGGDAERLAAALWEHRAAYDRGKLSMLEYWQLVAGAVGIDELSETEAAELQHIDDRYFLQLDPRSRALIHDLARNRVRMVLLSNASAAFGEAMRRADWFEAFSFAVISAEEGIAKPDLELFRIVIDALAHETGGVSRPSQAVFFDDRQDNVDAARSLGIDAHLWPRNQTGSEHGSEIARRVLAERGVPLS